MKNTSVVFKNAGGATLENGNEFEDKLLDDGKSF